LALDQKACADVKKSAKSYEHLYVSMLLQADMRECWDMVPLFYTRSSYNLVTGIRNVKSGEAPIEGRYPNDRKFIKLTKLKSLIKAP